AGLAMPLAAAADTGGTPAPTPGGTGTIDPNFLLTTSNSVFVGSPLQIKGFAADAAGQTVVIQSHVATGGWVPVATASADQSGHSRPPLVPADLRPVRAAGRAQRSPGSRLDHCVDLAQRPRLQARAGELVRTGLLRQAHRLRQEAEPRDDGSGAPHAGMRNYGRDPLCRPLDHGPGHRPWAVLERRVLGPHLRHGEEAGDEGHEPGRSRTNHASTNCPSPMSMSPIRSIVPARWPAPGSAR